MDVNDGLRTIPKVDTLLNETALKDLPYRQEVIKREVIEELARIRTSIRAGKREKSPDASEIAKTVVLALRSIMESGLRPVINATGVIVYTNLGRAPLAKQALEAMIESAGYSNLEYNLERGTRGSRQDHIRPIVCACFGVEDALVVNNNAAAVLLVLTSLAKGKEVIVSRGELVEIGGSFRMPDVMALSGAVLKEVGTTNKTRLPDYEKAVSGETALIMKVHRSNFAVIGFSEEVEIRDLSEFAHDKEIPLYVDMGSGMPFELDAFGIPDEWTIPACLKQGADVVSFSGDKVLGGPQAGIILGKRDLIQVMAKHPLHRAVRIDKLGVAALGATLRLLSQNGYQEIPVLRMISEPVLSVKARAEEYKGLLAMTSEIVTTQAVIGGGSAPTKAFPSYGVAVRSPEAPTLHARLRKEGIVCRIEENRLIFDMRTVDSSQVRTLAEKMNEVASGV